MTQKSKLRRVGGSLALIVPKPIADQMALREGDEVFISSNADGMSVSPYDPDFAEALKDAREFMRTHRDAFKKLAR